MRDTANEPPGSASLRPRMHRRQERCWRRSNNGLARVAAPPCVDRPIPVSTKVRGCSSTHSMRIPMCSCRTTPRGIQTFVEGAGYAKVKDLLAWSIDTHGTNWVSASRGSRSASANATAFSCVPWTCGSSTATWCTCRRSIGRRGRRTGDSFRRPRRRSVNWRRICVRSWTRRSHSLPRSTGRPVGCAIAIPNVNQVLKRMNGRLLPFGVFHFLRRGSIINQARVLLVGVVSELRHIGLYPLLTAEIFRRGVERGYRTAELSWTLEDNEAVNAGIEAAGGRRCKTYRLYEKRWDGREGSDRGQRRV